MKEIVRNTMHLYISICGVLVNGIAITYFIMKASLPKERVMSSPQEFIQDAVQIFTYGYRFMFAPALIILIISLILTVANYYEDKRLARARHHIKQLRKEAFINNETNNS